MLDLQASVLATELSMGIAVPGKLRDSTVGSDKKILFQLWTVFSPDILALVVFCWSLVCDFLLARYAKVLFTLVFAL